MTEEIIIDGVNVWSCKHYDLENNYCDQSYLGEGGLLKNTKNPKRCEGSPNCYYKQLKRLEQENKELKEMYRLSCLKCEYKNTKADVDKYRRALEEIREILIICQEFRTCERCKFYKECNKDLEGCITDKINEVLGTEAKKKGESPVTN